MRPLIDYFDAWQGGWEEGSDVVWSEPCLDDCMVGYQDNKSGGGV